MGPLGICGARSAECASQMGTFFMACAASLGSNKHGILKHPMNFMKLLLAQGKVHIATVQHVFKMPPSFLDSAFYHLRDAQKNIWAPRPIVGY